MELSELICSIDILDYIGQYTDFTLKNGEYWALSPLKEENTPSFSVRRETQSFYDFSSGVGGNVLTFVRYHDHCGYQQAIETLSRYRGLKSPAVRVEKLSAAQVARRFAPPLPRSAERPSPLPDGYMDRYENQSDKLALWEREGISRSSLEKFQIRYDRVSNRLVYPIRSPDGQIVNVGGRTLDPDWKEKKLRKYTYFFPWGEMCVIYGLWENREAIRAAGEVILFEGCKSVLLADTYGIPNTGAILTSHLSQNQLGLLIPRRLRVVFALDKDVDVRKDRNIARLSHYANVSYLYDRSGLLDEKDSPIDRGPEVFSQLYHERLVFR